MEKISVYELKRMDLRKAVVIDGFPSVGLVSTIAANYLIASMGLSQIGIIDSVYFPTVSVVRDCEPLNPVRMYGGNIVDKEGNEKIVVVFISEFQPPPKIIKLIAGTILDWIADQKCSILISPEGLVIEENELFENIQTKAFFKEAGNDDEMFVDGEGSERKGGMEEIFNPPYSLGGRGVFDAEGEDEKMGNDNSMTTDEAISQTPGQQNKGKEEKDSTSEKKNGNSSGVWGIASTMEARELLGGHEISPFTDGIVSGVAGVLINEGKRRGFPVIALLAEARPNIPDARAAAKVIEAIDNLVLNLGLDVKPLYKEAELIEKKIKLLRAQMAAHSEVRPSKSTNIHNMYG